MLHRVNTRIEERKITKSYSFLPSVLTETKKSELKTYHLVDQTDSENTEIVTERMNFLKF